MSPFPRWFSMAVGAVAIVIWVSSFIATVTIPTYKPDPLIGYIAAGVVSVCMASLRKPMIQGEEPKEGDKK